jgi:hypothetical protein
MARRTSAPGIGSECDDDPQHLRGRPIVAEFLADQMVYYAS